MGFAVLAKSTTAAVATFADFTGCTGCTTGGTTGTGAGVDVVWVRSRNRWKPEWSGPGAEERKRDGILRTWA